MLCFPWYICLTLDQRSVKIDDFRHCFSHSFYPRALCTGRWRFSAAQSMCVSLGYKLSSVTEQPSPEECLQDLSKHLQWRPDFKMLFAIFTLQNKEPFFVSLSLIFTYRHFCGQSKKLKSQRKV